MKVFELMFLLSALISLSVECKSVPLEKSDAHEFDISINAGNKVIEALEEFESDNLRYPDKLEELVPKYLTTIPLSEEGVSIEYSKFSWPLSNQKDELPGCSLAFQEGKVSALNSFFEYLGKKRNYFIYMDVPIYRSTDKQKLHYVYRGWAYVTYAGGEW